MLVFPYAVLRILQERFEAVRFLPLRLASWTESFKWLRGRGLNGVKLIIGDKCLGMLEAAGEVFPEAKYQLCIVHFYRNVLDAQGGSMRRKVEKQHSKRLKQLQKNSEA